MYNFNDHELSRKLAQNVPSLNVQNLNTLDNSIAVAAFIGFERDYAEYQNKLNSLFTTNEEQKNEFQKLLNTEEFKAQRKNLNGTDIITVGYDCNKQEIEEQSLTKICNQLIKNLRNDDPVTLTVLLTPSFYKKLHSLSTIFNALFEALPFNDNRFKAKETPVKFNVCKLNLVLVDNNQSTTDLANSYNKLCQDCSIGLQNILYARLLANLPGNICTPEYVGNEAQAIAEEFNSIDTYIYGKNELSEMHMNAYLAVANGSCHAPCMSVLSYNGDHDRKTGPIVIVGKGLTFDSGGISLKPGAGMDEMMFDKCGAISVLAIIRAAAMLKLKTNIVAIAACAENLPDSNSYRPGDIIKARNGTTIEVLNTDAEGRMVLCDALSYATTFNPCCIIDIATLTGACMVALGSYNTGIFSNSTELTHAFVKASRSSNDSAWPMPMGAMYEDMISGRFGDIANTGGRNAGATTAAQFLQHFVDNTPWVHLDIAGTAWVSGKSKTATGKPVALLLDFIKNTIL